MRREGGRKETGIGRKRQEEVRGDRGRRRHEEVDRRRQKETDGDHNR